MVLVLLKSVEFSGCFGFSGSVLFFWKCVRFSGSVFCFLESVFCFLELLQLCRSELGFLKVFWVY